MGASVPWRRRISWASKPVTLLYCVGSGLGFALGSVTAAQADNLALGQFLASECTTCHQLSGESTGGIPAITGWPKGQFVAVLRSYRAKERDNEVMQTIAGRLTDDEIAALAAFFEGQGKK